MLKNKRAFEMTFSTLVMIIIAIVLLIFLLTFLTKNFSTFKDKIDLFLGSSNVDNVVDSCNLYASNGQKYEYCCINKTIKVSSRQKYDMSCFLASEKSWGSEINKLDCMGVC
jgi:hypothetical protein